MLFATDSGKEQLWPVRNNHIIILIIIIIITILIIITIMTTICLAYLGCLSLSRPHTRHSDKYHRAACVLTIEAILVRVPA